MLIVCDVGGFEPFESHLDAETMAWLGTIPVVVLSDIAADKYQTSTLHVPVGTPGWTTGGDFVRSDGVPIPMSALCSSLYGTELRGVLDLFNELLVT